MNMKASYQRDIREQLDSATDQKQRWNTLVDLLREYIDRFTAFAELDDSSMSDMMEGPFWLLIKLGVDQCRIETMNSNSIATPNLKTSIDHLVRLVDAYSKSETSKLSASNVRSDILEAIVNVETDLQLR